MSLARSVTLSRAAGATAAHRRPCGRDKSSSSPPPPQTKAGEPYFRVALGLLGMMLKIALMAPVCISPPRRQWVALPRNSPPFNGHLPSCDEISMGRSLIWARVPAHVSPALRLCGSCPFGHAQKIYGSPRPRLISTLLAPTDFITSRDEAELRLESAAATAKRAACLLFLLAGHQKSRARPNTHTHTQSSVNYKPARRWLAMTGQEAN